MVNTSVAKHGGIRKGAGRSSTWASGCQFSETKLIRVPKILAEELLDIAHQLDAGVYPLQFTLFDMKAFQKLERET